MKMCYAYLRMKRVILIFAVVCLTVSLSMWWWSSWSKAHTTSDVLELAKPGVSASWLASRIDSRYREGAFEAFLIVDIDLHNRVIVPTSSLTEANYEVWLFEGRNDAAIIVFDKAFGVKYVTDTALIPMSVSKEWSYLKWKNLGLVR